MEIKLKKISEVEWEIPREGKMLVPGRIFAINIRYIKSSFLLLLMKFTEDLAAIHAYLCADGYVVKNPETQKHTYYRIGFRNTNLILLKDFRKRFQNFFGERPRLVIGQRCEKGSKIIYEKLIRNFNSFYSHKWRMPVLGKNLSQIWLRAFFDCEAWVFCKSHQNRHIGLDSVNKKGLEQINFLLNKLGIKTIQKINKKRKMYRIFIYGKENLIKFKKEIGFLHPDKAKKLKVSLGDYIIYKWDFPKDKKSRKRFVYKKLREKIRIKSPYYIRMISRELYNLEQLKKYLKKFYDINCIISKRINGIGTFYYELDINRKKEVKKLIKLKLIPNLFKFC